MTTTDPRTPATVDPERWPDVARVPDARLRARVARVLVRHAAARAGVHLRTAPDQGQDDGRPVLDLYDEDAFHRRLAASGLIGLGESYMAGEWDSPEPVTLLTRLAEVYEELVPRPLQPLRHITLPRRPASDRNTRSGARRHISHHYDVSNDLFALFLDRTMTYSSALFPLRTPGTPKGWRAPRNARSTGSWTAPERARAPACSRSAPAGANWPYAPPTAAPASPLSPSPVNSAIWPASGWPRPG